jgi:hypothetical protein
MFDAVEKHKAMEVLFCIVVVYKSIHYRWSFWKSMGLNGRIDVHSYGNEGMGLQVMYVFYLET